MIRELGLLAKGAFDYIGAWKQVQQYARLTARTENNGRPEWIRTIDLFRVKEAL